MVGWLVRWMAEDRYSSPTTHSARLRKLYISSSVSTIKVLTLNHPPTSICSLSLCAWPLENNLSFGPSQSPSVEFITILRHRSRLSLLSVIRFNYNFNYIPSFFNSQEDDRVHRDRERDALLQPATIPDAPILSQPPPPTNYMRPLLGYINFRPTRRSGSCSLDYGWEHNMRIIVYKGGYVWWWRRLYQNDNVGGWDSIFALFLRPRPSQYDNKIIIGIGSAPEASLQSRRVSSLLLQKQSVEPE